MCGINLILDGTGQLSGDAINNMLKATAHRGPHQDHSDIIRGGDWQLFLGVNRLRIIDDNEKSDQPFRSESGKSILLFNGEIYNFSDLKNTLLKNSVSFKTSSDTEVLYHHLRRSGSLTETLQQLNGMFSLVFIDPENQILHIARDPWGMKPLYYYQDDRYLIISSELKGIFATNLVRKDFNHNQIPHYLKYRYTEPDKTFFANVFQFLKGRYYAFDIRKNKWSNTRFEKKVISPKEEIPGERLIEKTEEYLVEALLTHTAGRHVPGIFLSGGIDSTLLLALARDHQIRLPYLFTIISKSNTASFGTDDYRFSRMAGEKYGGTEVRVEYDEQILSDLEEYVADLDHPVADGASLLTYQLSKEVVNKTHVVLSGAGADELFGGYNRHHAFAWYLKNYSKISLWKEPMAKILNLIPMGRSIPIRKKLQLINKFINRIEEDPYHTFDNFMSLNKFGKYPEFSDVPSNGSMGEERLLYHALERDRDEYLPEDVLTINDRASMSHHVEMRMPFLDNELSEYIRSLPSTQIMQHGPKWILKELLSKHGGREFIRRSKEGFGFPFGLWIRYKKYDFLISTIRSEASILEPHLEKSLLERIVSEHLSGKEDNSQELWAILILLLWIKHNFGEALF